MKMVRFFRTLRFRLAATFLLILTFVLVLIAWLSTTALKKVLETQSEAQLSSQIGALKGWFTFDESSGEPLWDEVDQSDPEEVAELIRLQRVYVIADEQGRLDRATTDPKLRALWDRKTILAQLAEMERTHTSMLRIIHDTDGVPYQVLSSIMKDSKHQTNWYVAEGRSLAEDRLVLRKFQRNCFIFFPIALVACAVVSWYSTGRALRRLQSVEKAVWRSRDRTSGCRFPNAAPMTSSTG